MIFLTHLDTRAISGGRWKLIGDLDVWIEGEYLVRVPIGFETDLASIPKGLRWFISQNEDHRKAAVLHDWLYFKSGDLDFLLFNREESDELFLKAMEVSGVSWFKRKIMFRAVRAFGWLFWGKV